MLGALVVVVHVDCAGGFGRVFVFAGVVVFMGVAAGDFEAANASVPSQRLLVRVLDGRGGARL